MQTASTVRLGAVPVAPGHGALQPLSLDEVRITGGFWSTRQTVNRDHTIPHAMSWIERAGWAGNFDAAVAGTLPAERQGREFSDSEIYKLLEALAWDLAVTPDPDRADRYDALVRRVAAAQEDDGYLNTEFGRPGQAPRYSDLEWGHELYCYGHLFQAAVARIRTGHHDQLVEVALAAAEHVCATFGPDGLQAFCGHPEIEMALVELGRATGRRHFVDQAALFLDRRGHHVLEDIEWGREYFQDDVPFRDAGSLRGHAVRALYLAGGAVDLADENGDPALREAALRQLRHAVAHRTYLTGGMGSQHQDEGFGTDDALPADRAYSETCAGIASVMLNWRLLLATGSAEHADLMERTLYNVVATGPALDGEAFFYANTLHRRSTGEVPPSDTLVARAESSVRAPWFAVSCCPTNIARTMASLAGYLATRDADGIQLHQYAGCEIRTTLTDGRAVALDVSTDYPRQGAVGVVVVGESVGPWSITFRVPSWAAGATLTHGGRTRTVDPGTVTVTDDFGPGDRIELVLPVLPRLTWPHPRFDAVRGCVAVERGPMVLCLESTDVPGADLAEVTLDPTVPLVDRVPVPAQDPRPWVAAEGSLSPSESAGWGYRDRPWASDAATPVELPLVPYCQWGNRGPSTMRVWIPVAEGRSAVADS
ncbi:glycoside hydrolase family 127 protein [Nakamurella flavida]|uniref:Glycoside hydrolase family 127 protein n=1 Tax=Nakamurella flavida TaxID=363630 RepID=A0A938YIZ5_9ACTN|nr:beta-L-arabinofuranosidase domain-containing protein [Nakamurella flavida]MBM9476842.1 glycoside hydrolase family 127 protein [Nakamurella flavida]MDP9778716.1 DUF1680 family protein [Nakamurella flavida]